MRMSKGNLKVEIWHAIEKLRETEPLVLCLTNFVVNNFTANILLAAGASPVMARERQEMRELAKLASGLLLNIGTVDRLQFRAMQKALTITKRTKIPVVLDIVGIGASQWRRSVTEQLLNKGKISIVRGNASEVIALMSEEKKSPKGVDTEHDSREALEMGKLLSRQHQVIVALSGKVDYIIDNRGKGATTKDAVNNAAQVIALKNGHVWLTKITGVGCALGALIAAIHACDLPPMISAIAATSLMNISGEIAAKKVLQEKLGLASMQAYLLDQLYILKKEDFDMYFNIDENSS